ncbi:MAG: hypothetical protein EOP81_12925 [Variovorax sp.]|nr:MAG: hypothetical protein EOP81_12925 [Variovorax sp.]
MSNPESSLHARRGRRRQRGVSLVELLVGIFLGLLVIGAAISTLMVSRATSGTIGDITQLQQQGSYAMRVMGMQFRQAGSIDIADDDTPELYLFKNNYTGLATTDRLNITGSDGTGTAADIVSVSNQPASGLPTQRRNCLGDELFVSVADSMDSRFTVDASKKALTCRSRGGSDNAVQTQQVIGNVADFQARYRVVNASGTQSLTATQVSAANLWSNVKAVEVCLHLEGDTTGDASVDGDYVNCQGAATARAGKLHIVLRNVFDLRPQGA